MFINQALPRCISQGSNFVITTAVDIARNPAGYDVRRKARSNSLRRADLSFNIRRIEDQEEQERSVYELLKHFEVCEGPTHSFPMLDRLDWKSCSPLETPTATDALLGEGDGVNAVFSFRKSYTMGPVTKYRNILLPFDVLVAVDGVPKTSVTHYNLTEDADGTVSITFTGGNIPVLYAQVTAGFKFYVKVRFEANDLTAAYEGFRVGSVGSIPVIEVRR